MCRGDHKGRGIGGRVITKHWTKDTNGRPAGSPLEVLRVFLKLGLSSFGGPIAHIGYFRQEFVVRRRWLDEQAFVDLVALCQFLPGPASSQVGFSIGLTRAGYRGALAAWTGFTLPSAIVLVLFAYGAGALSGTAGAGLLHGLKLVAVAIVAQAVWGMARTLCPDRERASIAVLTALIILFSSSSLAQIGSIFLGGLLGLWLCRGAPPPAEGHIVMPVSRRAGLVALTAFFVLLGGLPILQSFQIWSGVALFDAFYRSGALVFGGGHVVLPLLREAFVAPGWVSDDAFLAGYGAAQAVPGPLFTFAAYLGAVVGPSPHGVAGAALGLVGIFLPGILILLGALPFWDAFRKRADAQAAMRGVNASVVGLLGAALYNPIWTTSVKTPGDFGVALDRLCSSDDVARTAAARCRRRCAWGNGVSAGRAVIRDTPAQQQRTRLDRLADFVDLHRAHALIVDFDVEPADFEAGEIAHQKAVDAHAVERADISGNQRLALVVGKVERRQRLGRIGLHGGAKGMVPQNFTAQIIHGKNRHNGSRCRLCRLGSCCINVRALPSTCSMWMTPVTRGHLPKPS